MKGQSRWMSAVEAKTNLAAGFGLSWAINAWIIPRLLGIKMNGRQAFWGVVIFTTISFFRQYAIRRIFNALDTKRGNA